MNDAQPTEPQPPHAPADANQPAPDPPAADDDLAAALASGEVDQLMEAAMAADQPADQPAAPAPPAGTTDNPPQEIHHDVRRGRISAIRGEDVFIEITGEAKLQGVVPLVQFERPPRIGSLMDFVVDHIEEDQGLLYLSREGAVSRATWEQMVKGTVVEARVTGTNKGGLELELIGNIRAFMPASQIDLHHIDDLEPLIGQKLEAAVQEIDRKGRKVLLSRRAHLEQVRKRNRDKLLAELEVGQIRQGTVSNLQAFGAFIDLGGVDGLVHVTDIAHTRVEKPSDLLKPGDTVTVKVLKINADKDRISLGIKQVEPSPWEAIDGVIKPGQTLEGTVTRTAPFGAFIEIQPGVEGLLPISEMAWKRVHRAEEIVQVGQRLRLAVLAIDTGKQRLSLSLKAATDDPWIGASRKYEPDTWHDGTITSTTEFGAFVELETGIEGLLHISELSDRRVSRVDDIVKVGDNRSVRVKDIDEDQRKLSLSLKKKTAEEAAAQTPAFSPTDRTRPSVKRKPPKHLKSGLGNTDAMGTGLGSLRLDDFK